MTLRRTIGVAVRMTIATTLLLGVAYPLAVTGLAQILFRDKANGQLIARHRTVIGSRIIGQAFSSPRYFHGRPSVAGTGYDAGNSAGSNLGPTNKQLIDAVTANVKAECPEPCRGACPERCRGVPIDLVTASASGLDPHISPAAALFQVARVARARQCTEHDIRALVTEHTEGRQWGFLGEPRVNVLLLNLALDERWPTHP
jgi:K+-transporting ATPase ATPase C chain